MSERERERDANDEETAAPHPPFESERFARRNRRRRSGDLEKRERERVPESGGCEKKNGAWSMQMRNWSAHAFVCHCVGSSPSHIGSGKL